MFYPRVFIDGDEKTGTLEAYANKIPSIADVLIVCGQGVYENGKYYGEYHDRDVYFDHAIQFPAIASRFNFNTIVLSGGFTQSRAPWLSEAESFLRILQDANVNLPECPLILDEYALDSAENLLLGLMTARLVLGNAPIRRVGIWAAWKFKKWRFNRNAEALGIVENTYFYGAAQSFDTNIQVPPEDQNQRTFDEYRQDSIEYSLLRAKDKEIKRQNRWQNNRTDIDRDGSIVNLNRSALTLWSRSLLEDGTSEIKYDHKICSLYRNRLALLKDYPEAKFINVWKSLKLMEMGKTSDEAGLKTAWSHEIMTP